jgi:putative flavoprotein involved in K+ transport
MKSIDTVVIGAGQAGLATSRCLSVDGRDHVVLDRGRVAESWRSARWDSLRLLTPNWMTRLPGWTYAGADPDGFMTAAELAEYLSGYRASFGAPVMEHTAVTGVSPMAHGYRVTTLRGSWFARNVVLASGPIRVVPTLARQLSVDLHQLHTSTYRRPAQLPDGGVLVVGASASGAQIASELRRAGRRVVQAVGSHTSLPRRYRGMDIMWWLEQSGILGRTITEMPDPRAARTQPSLQLRGGTPGEDLNLAALADLGVEMTGRLVTADGPTVRFADDLRPTIAAAEERTRRTLDTIDRYAESTGLATGEPAVRERVLSAPEVIRELDLRAAGVTSVVWATGFRHSYPWLHVPVFDADGHIRQYRGITAAPGLYVVGERFLHRRDSSFIDGVRYDARTVTDHIRMSSRARPAPRRAEAVLEGAHIS